MIESMFIRVGVWIDMYVIGMYYNWSMVGYSKFMGFGYGIYWVKYIFFIVMNDVEVFKIGEVIGYFMIGSLIFFRDGNVIIVVLKYKNNWKMFVVGFVDSFIDKFFGCGRFIMWSNGNFFMFIINYGMFYVCCMKIVCIGSRRDIFDVLFWFGKVIGYVMFGIIWVCSFWNIV